MSERLLVPVLESIIFMCLQGIGFFFTFFVCNFWHVTVESFLHLIINTDPFNLLLSVCNNFYVYTEYLQTLSRNGPSNCFVIRFLWWILFCSFYLISCGYRLYFTSKMYSLENKNMYKIINKLRRCYWAK